MVRVVQNSSQFGWLTRAEVRGSNIELRNYQHLVRVSTLLSSLSFLCHYPCIFLYLTVPARATSAIQSGQSKSLREWGLKKSASEFHPAR